MKRLLFLILAASMIFSLAACGTEKAEDTLLPSPAPAADAQKDAMGSEYTVDAGAEHSGSEDAAADTYDADTDPELVAQVEAAEAMMFPEHSSDADFEAAYELLSAPVEAGNSQAMYLMGWLYQNARGVEQDFARAFELYSNSAAKNNSDAMVGLGSLYQGGYGLEQDYGKAAEWYTSAAELGNATAMYSLGNLAVFGHGMDVDYALAREWFEKAAELGNGSAMNNLGSLYQNGWGVEQDYQKALEWYRLTRAYTPPRKTLIISSKTALCSEPDLFWF